MLNTLYTIAGGIALTIGALGASDDFDGAKLAQNAFFSPEDELEAIDEQETTAEEVQVAKDIEEWNEIAAKVMSMSLTSEDELTDDEKLEIAVLTEEMPSDESEKMEEVSEIAEISQPEGLSEEEFYCMLENQYNAAIAALDSVDNSDANSNPEDNREKVADAEQQPKDDVNPEQPLDKAVASDSKTEDVDQSEQKVQVVDVSETYEEEPWVVVHGLPDIPDEDMDVLMGQKTEQPVNDDQNDKDASPEDIPFVEFDDTIVPDVDAPELDTFDLPLFNEEAEEAENVEVEDAEVETEDAEVEDVEVEDVEVEDVEVEDVDAKIEDVDAEEVEPIIVEAFEADAIEENSNDDALIIPSIEIPPAVISEQERAKISAEVDELVDQDENFNSWIPRPIPVADSVDDAQVETKPEEKFIQEFSKKNAKESILEDSGIDLND